MLSSEQMQLQLRKDHFNGEKTAVLIKQGYKSVKQRNTEKDVKKKKILKHLGSGRLKNLEKKTLTIN